MSSSSSFTSSSSSSSRSTSSSSRASSGSRRRFIQPSSSGSQHHQQQQQKRQQPSQPQNVPQMSILHQEFIKAALAAQKAQQDMLARCHIENYRKNPQYYSCLGSPPSTSTEPSRRWYETKYADEERKIVVRRRYEDMQLPEVKKPKLDEESELEALKKSKNFVKYFVQALVDYYAENMNNGTKT